MGSLGRVTKWTALKKQSTTVWCHYPQRRAPGNKVHSDVGPGTWRDGQGLYESRWGSVRGLAASALR